MSTVTFYAIRCDKCAFDLQYRGSDMFPTLDKANEVAIATGWTSPSKGKHLCKKCTEKKERKINERL